MIIQGTTSKRFSAARSATLASAVTAVLLAGLANQALAADSAAAKGKDTVEEVVVVGVRASLDSAQNIKREATAVVDSIVAEDVGKLPDNNVADALARVTGVQIRRDSGEANAVLIRGLPNISTLLNGREVFTTFQRFIALADIPANMLKRVDVVKTSTADELEGGIAGLINVETRNPFDEDGLHFHTNARGVYSDKSQKADPDLGLTVSDTWDVGVGQFGALFGASYQPRHYHEERAFNVEPDYKAGVNFNPDGSVAGFSATGGSFNAAHPAPVADFKGPFVMGNIPITGDRRRESFNGVLEWRPTDKSRIYAEGFTTDYKNDFELDFFVGLPFLGDGNISGTVVPGTNQMQTLTDHNVFTIDSTQANRQHSLTRQFALGGSYETGSNVKFSTDLSRTTSNNDFLNPIMDTSTIVPLVQVNTDDHGTAILNYGGPGYDIKNGRNFNIANWFDNFGHDEGKSWDWRGDVTWTPDNAGIFKGLGAGLRYADRRAESIKSFGGAAYPFLSTPTSSLPGLDALSEPMATGGPNYQLRQWYTPSASYLINNIDRVRQQTACLYDHNATSAALFALRNDPVTCARKLDPGSFFSDKEVTEAVYVQANLGGNLGSMPWTGIVGVRAVRTDQTLGGNIAQDLAGNGLLTYTPTEAKNSSNDYLPSATFKLNLTPDTITRLALSRTLTRPNFPDLNPGVTLSTIVSNTTGLTGAGGNPNLKPVKSDNIDLAYEWYFAKAGSLTATAFGRKFNGYVQPGHEDQIYGGLTYRITRPQNTGNGKLTGVEVTYQQFYDFLPSVLGGLGLQLNATFTNGHAEDPVTGEDKTITGVSKQSYNIIALYEKGQFSGRLAYNWRSKFPDTYAIAANLSSSRADLTAAPAVPGAYDLWVKATAQMDGSISYKPSDNFTLTFECINILDTQFKDYFVDQNQYPRDTRRYDRTYEVGFRASF